MREDTITTKVYKFNELSDEAKETAIEKMYDINVDYDWWDSTHEDAAAIGLVIEEFDTDRGSSCRGKWTEDAEDVARLIFEHHGEQCETRIDADRFLANLDTVRREFVGRQQAWEYEQVFEESDTYDELCEEFQCTICEDYSIILQKECEYLTSEEAIIGTIKANEYEFTEDGKLY